MRVLVTGASGFIGRHLVARLGAEGHEVVGVARNLEQARRLIPGIVWVHGDLDRDLAPEIWAPRLEAVEAVINCAGILQSSAGNDIRAVHETGPIALFGACETAGVRRVIQVSALGAGAAAGTEYAASKAAADDWLLASGLDGIVVRPSLVVGRDAYGGTVFFRALAALPWVLPLPGRGEQRFQPIAMDDVTEAILRLLRSGASSGRILDLVGPREMTLAEILLALRGWLGLGPPIPVPVPMAPIRLLARLGDCLRWFGGRGALSTTSIRQLEFGITADPAPFVEALAMTPLDLEDALARQPSGVADRWHARLYFLRPALRVSLGLFWLWTGIATAFFFPRAEGEALLAAVGVPAGLLPLAFWLGCLLDVVLGLLLLARVQVRAVAGLQIAITLPYMVMLTLAMPELWFHPLGPMSKLVPLLVATAVLMAIEDDR